MKVGMAYSYCNLTMKNCKFSEMLIQAGKYLNSYKKIMLVTCDSIIVGMRHLFEIFDDCKGPVTSTLEHKILYPEQLIQMSQEFHNVAF